MPIPNDTSSERSRRGVSNADLFGTDTIPAAVEIKSAQECVIYTVLYCRGVCLLGLWPCLRAHTCKMLPGGAKRPRLVAILVSCFVRRRSGTVLGAWLGPVVSCALVGRPAAGHTAGESFSLFVFCLGSRCRCLRRVVVVCLALRFSEIGLRKGRPAQNP